MTKKNDKRLCWSCEGNVSHHLSQCPYCGVDLTKPREENSVFKGYASPFQTAPNQEIPQPPYARAQTKDFAVTKEEWDRALNPETPAPAPEEPKITANSRREIFAFLLLLPGIVFFLFGLTLVFFSKGGVLTLQWNQSFAYFYFIGAAPLVYLGWRNLT